MGVRTRSATPGTLLCLAATALLAVVSFNTPLLKSLYFLEATYTSGQYAGTMKLGTLGYCLTSSSNTTCVGPQVGYEFDPNDVFGISAFDIPETITKYLTYTLILHIVALAAAVCATVFGLVSHIPSLSVLCFPTCFASITSGLALIALVFDLVIFYIARARINNVSGASASIGVSVWLVLAAWLVAGFGGCAYGLGRCCVNRRGSREPGDPKGAYYANQAQTEDMRMQALRDEQLRKKEQGLPSFQEHERTPLTAEEDKYLYEEPASNLARDGSLLSGVGVGYGRRNNGGQGAGYAYSNLQTPAPLARRDTVASSTGPGNAGIGAGPAGIVEPLPPQGYNGYYGNQGNNYYNGYNDPYTQQPYDQQPFDQQQYPQGQEPYEQLRVYDQGPQQYDQNGYDQQQPYDPQQQQPYSYSNAQPSHQYPPVAAAAAIPIPTPSTSRGGLDPYGNTAQSADSHYSNPGPRVAHADPYDAYDDGLGAIGAAATSTSPAPEHQRDYTGQNYGGGYGVASSTSGNQPQIQVPTPQHLATHGSAHDLLRSPTSQVSAVPNDPYAVLGAGDSGNQYLDTDQPTNRPPSYGAVAGSANGSGNGYANEKSSYR